MIELEILNSPDTEVLGIRKFHFDQIIIGNSSKNNFVINDPDIDHFHLLIEVNDTGAICRSLKENSFLHEEKRWLGEKSLHPNSVIQIGNTLLKIVSFCKNPVKVLTTNYEEMYQKAYENYSEIIEILDQLENEIKLIQQDKNA